MLGIVVANLLRYFPTETALTIAPLVGITPLIWEIIKSLILERIKIKTLREFELINIFDNIIGIVSSGYFIFYILTSLSIHHHSEIFISSLILAIAVISITKMSGGNDLFYQTKNHFPKYIIIVLGLISFIYFLNTPTIIESSENSQVSILMAFWRGFQGAILFVAIQMILGNPNILSLYSQNANSVISMSFPIILTLGHVTLDPTYVIIIAGLLLAFVFGSGYMHFKKRGRTILHMLIVFLFGKVIVNYLFIVAGISNSQLAYNIFITTYLISSSILVVFVTSVSMGANVGVPTIFYQHKRVIYSIMAVCLVPLVVDVTDRGWDPHMTWTIVGIVFVIACNREYQRDSHVPATLSHRSFKLGSLNIRGGYDRYGYESKGALLQMIQEKGCDFLAFQEANGMTFLNKFRDLLSSFSLNCSLYFDTQPLIENDLYVNDDIFPVTGSRIKPLNHQYVQLPSISHNRCRRWVEKSEYSVGGESVYIWNTHLSAFSPEEKVVQLKSILEQAKTVSRLVICGDFNLDIEFEQRESPDPGSIVPKEILNGKTTKQWFLDLIECYNLKLAKPAESIYPITYRDFDSTGSLDYMLYRGVSLLGNVSVTDSEVSDHNMITTQFSLDE